MGLSIHYHGRFSKQAGLGRMVEEVRDIAAVFQWPYKIFETEFPPGALETAAYDGAIYGISVTPPECETLFLTFLSNGRMSTSWALLLLDKMNSAPTDAYLYHVSVKTQFAGKEMHKLILNLLHHISGKYFSEFHLDDEGGYWNTWDEAILDAAFERYTKCFDQITEAIQLIPIKEGESFEAYLKRVLNQGSGFDPSS